MRLSVALVCLLLVGCAGPHTTGALWTQQNIDRELLLFHLSDAQRAEQARTFENDLADLTLAAEQSRIQAALQDCPGDIRQPLAVSVGDRPRDTIRFQAQGDAARLNAVANIALADWRVRRARATGDARFCDQARQALTGDGGEPAASDLLSQLGTATVTRDPLHSAEPVEDRTPSLALSDYAIGAVDTVRSTAPLPQYLAAVYGGVVTEDSARPPLNGATPAALVDQIALAYPEWEPDALYAVLSAP